MLRELVKAWRTSLRSSGEVRRKETAIIRKSCWVGIPIFFVLLLLIVTRRLRIRGFTKYVRAIYRGKVLISPNHPSFFEPFFLANLFWFCPFVAPSWFPYSVPDRRTFLPKDLWWLHRYARCVDIDRGTRGNLSKGEKLIAARHTRSQMERFQEFILKHGQVGIIFFELGRTWSRKENDPPFLMGDHGRRIRAIKPSAVEPFVGDEDLLFQPVWIEWGGPPLTRNETVRESFRRLFRHGMTISFGMPLSLHGKSSADAASELSDAIVHVGLPEGGDKT